MARIKEQLAAVANDLLNLEVNTIIKSNITGEKMPDPRHALIDIAKVYAVKLTELGQPLEDDRLLPGTHDYFEAVRKSAKKAINVMEQTAQAGGLTRRQKADLAILLRIKTMSAHIKSILNALGQRTKSTGTLDFDRTSIEQTKIPAFTASELTRIRKIWEMGDSQIAMQTIIQLDGDVITSVQPFYADACHQGLHLIHSQGVATSLQFWQGLINIVQTSLKSLLKLTG